MIKIELKSKKLQNTPNYLITEKAEKILDEITLIDGWINNHPMMTPQDANLGDCSECPTGGAVECGLCPGNSNRQLVQQAVEALRRRVSRPVSQEQWAEVHGESPAG